MAETPGLPMPVPPDYIKPSGRFFHYVWDTSDVPPIQEIDKDTAVITPTFHQLQIYGREVLPDPEDVREGFLVRDDRILGQWFSTACPGGEVGTVSAAECDQISPQQFSDAYMSGWERGGKPDE